MATTQQLIQYFLGGGSLKDLSSRDRRRVMDYLMQNPQILSSVSMQVAGRFGETGLEQFDPTRTYDAGMPSFEAAYNPVLLSYQARDPLEAQVASDFFEQSLVDPTVALANLSVDTLKNAYGLDDARAASLAARLTQDQEKFLEKEADKGTASLRQNYQAWAKQAEKAGAGSPSAMLERALGIKGVGNLPAPDVPYSFKPEDIASLKSVQDLLAKVAPKGPEVTDADKLALLQQAYRKAGKVKEESTYSWAGSKPRKASWNPMSWTGALASEISRTAEDIWDTNRGNPANRNTVEVGLPQTLEEGIAGADEKVMKEYQALVKKDPRAKQSLRSEAIKREVLNQLVNRLNQVGSSLAQKGVTPYSIGVRNLTQFSR